MKLPRLSLHKKSVHQTDEMLISHSNAQPEVSLKGIVGKIEVLPNSHCPDFAVIQDGNFAKYQEMAIFWKDYSLVFGE